MLGSVVATVCSSVLGAIWYHPKGLSGGIWLRRTHPGKTANDVSQEKKSAMGLSVIVMFTINLLLRFILVDFLHIKTVLDGIKFTVGLSCLTTLLEVPHCLFSNHSVDAFIIDQIHNLLVLIVSGACIAYFL